MPLTIEESGAAALRGTPAIPVNGRETPAGRIECWTGDPNFMTSLARGLAVIQAFGEKRRRLSIAQVSYRTGLSRAAVRRCLYTLNKLGYVEAIEHAYVLQPKILELGRAYRGINDAAMDDDPS